MDQQQLEQLATLLPAEERPKKITSTEWSSLRPSQRIIVRLKASSELLGAEVVTNNLARQLSPTIEIRQLQGLETALIKRRDIRDIQRLGN